MGGGRLGEARAVITGWLIRLTLWLFPSVLDCRIAIEEFTSAGEKQIMCSLSPKRLSGRT